MSSDADDLDETTAAGSRAERMRDLLNMRGHVPAVQLAAGQQIGASYEIQRELGAGGMGVVYLAHDRSLGRDVAIKLHTAVSARGGERLRREAAALARLVHPNVVTVYEIGAWNDHPYVAMEFVPGGTARDWLAAGARTVPAILALYASAGRGLAAAHAAGLVHRDFKPDNVLVGDDGRVRVADFGLARAFDSVDDPAPDAAGPEAQPALTQTGAMVGTPAYMAPEQRTGGAVGAAADQYAFAVALWEALDGQRPHAGDTGAQIQASVEAGRPREPNRARMPAWVQRTLTRALARDPAARFASMDALLVELARDPAARRRRVALTVGAIAAVGTLVVGSAWMARRGGADARPGCADAGREIASVWGAAPRAAVADAFTRTGRPAADATASRVAAALDERATAWTAMRIEACQATHVRSTQSAALLDLRMRCLDRRLDQLGGLVQVLTSGDGDVVDHAVEAAAALPPIDDCADTDALERRTPLPDDPALRERIAALERRLADVEALTAAGRYTAALPLAEALATDAGAIDYPPLQATVGANRAHLLRYLGRWVDAEAAYHDALPLASAARDDRVAFDLWRGLIELRVASKKVADTDVIATSALAAAARLPDSDFRRARLESSLSLLRSQQARPREAFELAERAQAWFADHVPNTIDHGSSLLALASAQEANGAYEEALASYDQALVIVTAMYGADHPDVGYVHQAHAQVLVVLSRYDEALAELDALAAPIERAYGADSAARGALDLSLADAHRRVGAIDAAVAAYQRALAIFGTRSPKNRAKALIGLAALELDRGRFTEARDQLLEAVQVLDRESERDERTLVAALLYLGTALNQLGDIDGQATSLARAFEISTRLYGPGSLEIAQLENSLGMLATAQGAHAEAMAHFERSIAVAEALLGPDSLDVLFARHNLATDLVDQERWAEALAHDEAVLTGLEPLIGATNPMLCAVLVQLAFVYAMVDRGAEGVQAGRRCETLLGGAGQEGDAYLELGLGAAIYASGGDRGVARRKVKHAAEMFRIQSDNPANLPRAEKWLRTHR